MTAMTIYSTATSYRERFDILIG